MVLDRSKRQWLSLLVLSTANFFSAMCVSLQAPFFPAEAEKKGATASEYGLIFGVFELVGFLVSPLYGNYMKKIGVKRLYNTGIFTAGIFVIIFGMLDRIPEHYAFIGTAFFCRIVEAAGTYAFFTASFAVIAVEFPNNIATTFAAMESCFGIGMIFGPVVGEALYTLGGYYLPFVILGSCFLAIGVLVVFILPKIVSPPDEIEKRGMLKVLKIPGVLVCAIGISTTSLTLGFLSATLEPHIRQFNLNNLVVGLIFVCNGGMYALSSPFWGMLVDKKLNPKLLAFLGAICIIVGFLTVGPSSFLPFEPTVASVVAGLILQGIGMGAIFVTSFSDALETAVRHGFSNTVNTYGLISGMWTTFFALGAFMGPSISGVLFDSFGFRKSVNFVIFLEILVAIMFLIFGLFHEENTGRRSDSSELDNISTSIEENEDEKSVLIPKANGYGSTYQETVG